MRERLGAGEKRAVCDHSTERVLRFAGGQVADRAQGAEQLRETGLDFAGAREQSAVAEQVKQSLPFVSRPGLLIRTCSPTIDAPGASAANDRATEVVAGIAVLEFHEVSRTSAADHNPKSDGESDDAFF